MKTIKWEQGDITYEIKGLLGCIAESKERKGTVQVGDTRRIAGMLMYAWRIQRGVLFGKDTISWVSVEDIDYPKIQKFVQNLKD